MEPRRKEPGQGKPGLVLIYTGEGKGKTTAALGSALRAVGQGLRVLMIQFIKGGRSYGELEAAGQVAGLEIRPMGLGLIGRQKDLAPHHQAARRAWDAARRAVVEPAWDMVILDEVFLALSRGFLQAGEIAELIKGKPAGLHLVLTGRHCPPELFELADAVTEMRAVKHHLKAGIKSQPGIEY